MCLPITVFFLLMQCLTASERISDHCNHTSAYDFDHHNNVNDVLSLFQARAQKVLVPARLPASQAKNENQTDDESQAEDDVAPLALLELSLEEVKKEDLLLPLNGHVAPAPVEPPAIGEEVASVDSEKAYNAGAERSMQNTSASTAINSKEASEGSMILFWLLIGLLFIMCLVVGLIAIYENDQPYQPSKSRDMQSFDTAVPSSRTLMGRDGRRTSSTSSSNRLMPPQRGSPPEPGGRPLPPERVSPPERISFNPSVSSDKQRYTGGGSLSRLETSPEIKQQKPLLQMCPGLILPHFDAELVITMESLMQGSGSWDICGLSGNALLHCSFRENSSRRRLVDISLAATKNFPLGSFGIDAAAYGEQPVILWPDQKVYGVLQPTFGGSFALLVNGVEALHIKQDANNQILLGIPGESKAIANAGQNSDSPEKLIVHVDAGADCVLMLCCVLAILFFGQSGQS